MLSCEGYNWLPRLWSLITHIHCHAVQIKSIMKYMPVSPHSKCCLLILTTESVSESCCLILDTKCMSFKHWPATAISTITWISFYQCSADIIKSPVWRNTEPLLKPRPCRKKLCFYWLSAEGFLLHIPECLMKVITAADKAALCNFPRVQGY